jgi:hypothetical protein
MVRSKQREVLQSGYLNVNDQGLVPFTNPAFSLVERRVHVEVQIREVILQCAMQVR